MSASASIGFSPLDSCLELRRELLRDSNLLDNRLLPVTIGVTQIVRVPSQLARQLGWQPVERAEAVDVVNVLLVGDGRRVAEDGDGADELGDGERPEADAEELENHHDDFLDCLLYTSPSPRDRQKSRMPSSA